MANKESKPKKKRIQIDLDANEIDSYKPPSLPDNLKTWDDKEKISDEYADMVAVGKYLAKYLAMCCNDGPECKDNIGKRIITAKIFLSTFVHYLSINAWTLYGLVFEELNDVYSLCSGRQHTLNLLREVSEACEKHKKSKRKTSKQRDYVS